MESLKKPRVTKEEQEFLGSFFKDREDLVILIRDLFFGFTLTAAEKGTIKTLFANVELRRLMRKIFLPELERGLPVGESVDLWMTLKLGTDEKENKLNIKARKLLIEWFDTALNLLEDPNGKKISVVPELETIALLTRVSFTTNVEARLNEIWIMSHKKEESDESKAVRMAQDSLK